MARDYEQWDMSDDTRRQLGESIESGAYSGAPEARDAQGVQAMQDELGREELTRRLSGTDDKRSRAWKSARDSLSRWRSGRRAVSSQAAGRLQGASRAFWRLGMRQRGSVHVDLTVTVRTSRTSWTGVMSADLTGGALEDYLDALEAGNFEGVAQVVADNYGLDPEYIESVESVHGFEQDLPPGDEE